MRRNTDANFWDRVDISGGPDACWPWQGRLKPPTRANPIGHGLYDHDNTYSYAHRYAWTLMYGPPKDFICHHCDNPPCCNPRHLYDGTQAQNVRDRDSRGRRNVKGERHPKAKLTQAQVDRIRLEPRTSGYRLRLAAQYNVQPCTISAIVGGRNWK